ncbi:MAG: eukaryotic-type primase-like protein, partial [Ramlibacter sp.]|nr:eukaryotic-type primase-like protein [Ramlibacter sp.]
WEELDACNPADFTLWTMPERFRKIGDPHARIDAQPDSLESVLELAARQEAEGQGDAPWPPHYRKGADEPKRAPPSTARKKAPLIEVARVAREAEAIAAAEEWKAKHPKAAAHLEPADVLVDRMRESSSVSYRVRINLTHVPSRLRP